MFQRKLLMHGINKMQQNNRALAITPRDEFTDSEKKEFFIQEK
ncbi:MAG: hypothetical protein ACJAV1_001820 [Paraglaciecola sp.]|jgi:hypothetical protein